MIHTLSKMSWRGKWAASRLSKYLLIHWLTHWGLQLSPVEETESRHHFIPEVIKKSLLVFNCILTWNNQSLYLLVKIRIRDQQPCQKKLFRYLQKAITLSLSHLIFSSEKAFICYNFKTLLRSNKCSLMNKIVIKQESAIKSYENSRGPWSFFPSLFSFLALISLLTEKEIKT
jgi:hypothetical protein